MNEVPRTSWGASMPQATRWQHREPASVQVIHVHHTDTEPPASQAAAVSAVQAIQRYHMDTNGWADIGYHFLVSPQGDVFFGRPISVVGAETQGHNTDSIGVAFLAQDEPLTPAAIDAFNELATELVGKVGHGLELRPHSSDYPTACPGDWIRSAIGVELTAPHPPTPAPAPAPAPAPTPPPAPPAPAPTEVTDVAPTDVVAQLGHKDGLPAGRSMRLTHDGGVQLLGFAEGEPVPTYTAMATSGETYTFPYTEDGETIISYPRVAEKHHDTPRRFFVFFLGAPSDE